MGLIEEDFDRECISHFERGEPAALCEFLTKRLPQVGNGGSGLGTELGVHERIAVGGVADADGVAEFVENGGLDIDAAASGARGIVGEDLGG